MQFGFFALLVAAALIESCDVTSASTNVALTLSKTTSSNFIVNSGENVPVHGKVNRFLRTGTSDGAAHQTESDDGERAITLNENVSSFVAKLTRQNSKKTFGSPPIADILPRSKSFSGNNAAAQKLTRSQSANAFKDIRLRDVKEMGKNFLKGTFKTMDRQKQTPDDMVDFFNLDAKWLAKADKYELREGPKGIANELWYGFTRYYKKKYPNWVSELVKG
ncbi:hypothetical protein PF005_g29405 [Phytophthora fragariae]|uniref:RxLR effector protein n=1 Tax=Phytophthora fragariae TaxID=53985 RepID=A0A6A3Q8G1_9STRA|nr:hypothetical protein PF003_g13593 [Phytophthora fragariae]KAE8920589.1 hypothetical protein PF009_g29119 [Phytophthora fragariae]KAE8964771.1 hypothetical protein PF011_g28546 [Phytophthora fragariae]KAE9064589.1 hypothetical protein PF010_g28546 [Phytophthora fragariae]KAE9070848.1 hypothetical protein PF006_g29272 [Phytophthora fragariae]